MKGSPSGRSLSRFLQHKATSGVFLLPLGGIQVQNRVPPSIKFAGTWVERSTVKFSVLWKNTTQCVWPGLKARLLDPEVSTITMKPLCLHTSNHLIIHLIIFTTLQLVAVLFFSDNVRFLKIFNIFFPRKITPRGYMWHFKNQNVLSKSRKLILPEGLR